jgi:hypothetical protein
MIYSEQAIICDAYAEEAETGRKVLRFHPSVAPYMFAVSAVAKDGGPLEAARDRVYTLLSDWASVALDTKGTSVGKKYRRHDEIGTPYFVMVDSEGYVLILFCLFLCFFLFFLFFVTLSLPLVISLLANIFWFFFVLFMLKLLVILYSCCIASLLN